MKKIVIFLSILLFLAAGIGGCVEDESSSGGLELVLSIADDHIIESQTNTKLTLSLINTDSNSKDLGLGYETTRYIKKIETNKEWVIDEASGSGLISINGNSEIDLTSELLASWYFQFLEGNDAATGSYEIYYTLKLNGEFLTSNTCTLSVEPGS